MKNKFKLLLAGLFCLIFMISASNLSAWRGYGHYYRYGGWYGGWYGWYGPRVVYYVGMPSGVIVDFLPSGYSTVIVGGVPYYCYNNVYYKELPDEDGYVVVPNPSANSDEQSASATSPTASSSTTITPKAAGKSANKITINIPNAHGGFTPVTLNKFKNGYIGPQGEFYEGKPSIEQLKVLYGE